MVSGTFKVVVCRMGEMFGLEASFLTFNIHHGVGMDGVLDLGRIARVIQESCAEVVALQEVDRFFSVRSDYQDQAKILAELLGYAYCYGANLDYEPEENHTKNRQHGLAILSRYPITTDNHYLLPSDQEQRGLLHAKVQINGVPVHICNVHLGLSTLERLEQIQAIHNVIKHFEEPVVVMGDFNSEPGSKELRLLEKSSILKVSMHNQNLFHSFPANNPNQRIDYIFTSKELKKIWEQAIESMASDHLPVLAKITIK